MDMTTAADEFTTFTPHAWIKTPNRYSGRCCTCGAKVAAGQGFYNENNVFCGQPGKVGNLTHLCPVRAETEIIENGKPQVQRARIEKAAAAKAERDAAMARMAAEDARWARQGLARCKRCGGVGGASHWPGYTCYECGGRGVTAAK